MNKTCKTCKIDKETTEFSQNSGRKDGLHYECKDCSHQRSKAYRERNLEKNRKRVSDWIKANPEKNRSTRLKHYYGIDLEEYNQLLERQKHKCAICSTPQKDLQKALYVDHDHTTKEVRGLLCHSCNSGLGNFKDSLTNLLKAIDYLSPSKHSKNEVTSVDRKAFLSAIGLTSMVLQAMGDEFESFRSAREMDPEMRKLVMHLVQAHLKNVANISHALQHSVIDPLDPEGIALPSLN